jgi:outer membrane protein TolC
MAFDGRTLTNAPLREFAESTEAEFIGNWPPPKWNLEALTVVAFYYHPALQTARARWETALAGVETAGAHPNPTVTLSPGYDFSAVSPASPWIPGLTLDFPIETAGKRGIRRAQARRLAWAARFDLLNLCSELRSNVHAAYIETSAANDRVKLIEEELKTQKSIDQLLEQRLSAGAIASSELLPMRINLLKLQGELGAARRLLSEGRRRLAEALGVPQKALVNLELKQEENPEIRGEKLLDSMAALRAKVLRQRFNLLAALARYEASQESLQLEIARQYPDIRLGSGYQWDQGDHKWNLSIGLDLPLLNQNQGPIAEARARREEAAAQVIELQSAVIQEIDSAAARCRLALDEMTQARKIASRLMEQEDSAAERLQAGAADRLELASVQLERHTAELTLLEANTRLRMAEAELEQALQIPFGALEPFLAEAVSGGRKK